MIKIIMILLRALAVLIIGLFAAFIGAVVGSNLFIISGLELFGLQGYEAGLPIGLLLGALIGFIGSGLLLFGKRTER
jgi:hypothetical protein